MNEWKGSRENVAVFTQSHEAAPRSVQHGGNPQGFVPQMLRTESSCGLWFPWSSGNLPACLSWQGLCLLPCVHSSKVISRLGLWAAGGQPSARAHFSSPFSWDLASSYSNWSWGYYRCARIQNARCPTATIPVYSVVKLELLIGSTSEGVRLISSHADRINRPARLTSDLWNPLRSIAASSACLHLIAGRKQ